MSKNIWIIANWKAHKTTTEALDWISQVGPNIPENDNIKVVVCPAFSALSEVKNAVLAGGYPILIGSQDISAFGVGAYTGEEPGEVLKQFIGLTLIGHSERREYFGETDKTVEEKVKMALNSDITPLVCIQGTATPVPDGCKLVAYEPAFAIGTGTPDTPENAREVALEIKAKTGAEVLYGGSVDQSNIRNFLKIKDINGVLIGKASLDPNEFIKIIEEAAVESSEV